MTLKETAGLRKIRRERIWILIWILTYVPVVCIVKYGLHLHDAAGPVAFIWVAALVGNFARVIYSRCPRCAGLFFSADESASVRNLFTSKCMHCGLSLKPERVMYPSLE
jgi:hypothetical protein